MHDRRTTLRVEKEKEMTQKELQLELGNAITILSSSLKNRKYNERDIKAIQTMCGVAKQMINNADIILRASKMVGDKEACKDLVK